MTPRQDRERWLLTSVGYILFFVIRRWLHTAYGAASDTQQRSSVGLWYRRGGVSPGGRGRR